MKNKTVSIIVPAYNSEKYIGRCINSLIRQTYHYIEIIVVDDGSIDKTSDVVNKFIKKDSRIRLISIKNSGPSMARSIGLKHATGDYVMFVDSDDYLYDCACDKIVECFGNNPQIDSIKFNFDADEKKYLGILQNTEECILNRDEIIKKILFSDYFSNIWSQAFILEKIKAADMFDNHLVYCEDYLSNYMVHVKIGKALLITDRLYYYCNNDSSTTHRNMASSMARKCQDRIESGHTIYCNMSKELKRKYGREFLCRQIDLIQEELSKIAFSGIDKKNFFAIIYRIMESEGYKCYVKKVSKKDVKKYITLLPLPKRIKRGGCIMSVYRGKMLKLYYVYGAYRWIKGLSKNV